jgi:deltex
MSSTFGVPAATSAVAVPSVQWYYFNDHSYTALSYGWYVYDANFIHIVEHLYQEAMSTPGGLYDKKLLPVASNGYHYELDFQRMVQRNLTSNKERSIYRSSNGLPPSITPSVPPSISMRNPSPAANAIVTRRGRRCRTDDTCVSTQYSSSLSYAAPESLHVLEVDETRVFQVVSAPPSRRPLKRLKKGDECNEGLDDEECAICLDSLWNASDGRDSSNRVIALKTCRHLFHYACIQQTLTMGCGEKCPLCLKPIDEHECGMAKTSKGKCPSATMNVSNQPGRSCGGYEGYDTLQITYSIPSGIQKKYHPAPNLPFSGTSRIAYLPNNREGRLVLCRMEYAFMHGLCFMVGTSLTTGRNNTVTWASIHHKTSYGGGTFGFPDPSYFQRANNELNSLGVPNPGKCRAWLLVNIPGYNSSVEGV